MMKKHEKSAPARQEGERERETIAAGTEKTICGRRRKNRFGKWVQEMKRPGTSLLIIHFACQSLVVVTLCAASSNGRLIHPLCFRLLNEQLDTAQNAMSINSSPRRNSKSAASRSVHRKGEET